MEAILNYQLPYDLPGSWVEQKYIEFFNAIEGYHPHAIIAITFAAHVLVYQLMYIPFLLIELTPAFDKYKIQRNRQPTWGMRWNCWKQVVWQQFTGQLPLIFGIPMMFKILGNEYLGPLPSLKTVVGTCIFALILEDTWHYWLHRLIHAVPPMHVFIHKLHHEHFYPFALTAEYATISETLTLGIGTMLGPFILRSHWFTMLVWMCVRDWESLDAHAGYDLPWSPHNIIPFWGGAKFHDFHHSNVLGNYSSTFTWWDWLCGTDQMYYKSVAKKKAAAGTKGNADSGASSDSDSGAGAKKAGGKKAAKKTK